MSLITEGGSFDRAAVTARAKEIYRAGNTVWGAARKRAYDEARDELRARFGRVSTIAISEQRKTAA